jgi:uncharacterized ParB-like nuclease family protein
MPVTTDINVADIVATKAMMMRQGLNKATITKYAKAMADGAVFPPIVIFEVDGQLILADGYHRHAAYQKLGIEKIAADVRMGTMDDALLAAVRADAHDGLKRTPADKEKAVRALLSSARWREMSDREIGREANVSQPYVSKLRKSINRTDNVISSNGTRMETRMGKDGKRRPVARSNASTRAQHAAPAPAAAPPSAPAAATAPSNSYYKPFPKLTREQIGAPAEGTENEQDPDSPPGVTRAQAWSQKYGHVHFRPLDQRLRAEGEKKATSLAAAMRELEKPIAEVMKYSDDPNKLLAIYSQMKGPIPGKFRDRLAVIEPFAAFINALSAAARAGKTAA